MSENVTSIFAFFVSILDFTDDDGLDNTIWIKERKKLMSRRIRNSKLGHLTDGWRLLTASLALKLEEEHDD